MSSSKEKEDMYKAMVFIDDSWLHKNLGTLGAKLGVSRYAVDIDKLQKFLIERVSSFMSKGESISLVRTFLFGSHPTNVDEQDREDANKQLRRLDWLKAAGTEVVTFGLDFKGQRLRSKDRQQKPDNDHELREKRVDVSMATTMVDLAHEPGAFDIAIVVSGDQDYIPALQCIRAHGKRVAIATTNRSGSHALTGHRHEGVRDFPIIWLELAAGDIQFKLQTRLLTCVSEYHDGNREFESTYNPAPNERVFCEECRRKFRSGNEEEERWDDCLAEVLLDPVDEQDD